ncbi:MAG TPA: antibiotic biosynthesis monooxygenase family protein [Dyella sp.]|uniref:putative quinol monooxygenase n=1 Tax=Dyella sp. TaxID=1869338 RepID=UPI002D773A5D|nr:antibiotic biosynthesis monooxygenase family protein [Dyella sp.]HET6552435.1 antibiotic biosynthesis monooxygenase family protein [Dyella sp.]
MPTHPVVLVNLLKVEPGRQEELVALLKHNIEAVVSTLSGWKASRLMAAADGQGVVIYSEWETPAAVDAMRADPRMQAYFPRIRELASFESMMASEVFGRSR